MEKEKKKLNFKIIIPVIIAIVIIAVLGGIILKQQKDINIIKEKLGISDTKTETKGIKILTQEELSKYIKEIPITTDNWKDYVTMENKTEEEEDTFGEVIGYINKHYLKIKGDNIYGYLLLEVNFTDKTYNDNLKTNINVTSGQETNLNVLDIRNSDKTYNINDLQCTRLKGKLYTIDLPDDIWENNNEISIETSEKYRENMHGDNEEIFITKNNYIEQLGRMIYWEYTSLGY